MKRGSYIYIYIEWFKFCARPGLITILFRIQQIDVVLQDLLIQLTTMPKSTLL